LVIGVMSVGLIACGDDGVDSEEEARIAYLGLDEGVDRAMKLGFDGYNAASNANIPDQSEPGDLSGTMTVGGKVDQGASNNKEMDLEVRLDDYADEEVEDQYDIRYDTGSPLLLGLSLKGLPNADMTGTFTGTVDMTEAIEGVLTLNLSITGKTEEATDGTIQRAPGTVRITGTAESENGIYDVDVTY
jgi:hypothetical protein